MNASHVQSKIHGSSDQAMQRKVVNNLWVGEERTVKVQTDAFLLSPINPVLEVLRFKFIQVLLLTGNRMESVNLDPLLTRNEGQGLVQVTCQLIRVLATPG